MGISLRDKFNAINYLVGNGIVFAITENTALRDIHIDPHWLDAGDIIIIQAVTMDSIDIETAHFDLLVKHREGGESLWKVSTEMIWDRILPCCQKIDSVMDGYFI